MKCTILGSGTYRPELERHSSSYLLQTQNSNIVFDFGRGVLDQLMKIGIKYTDIDAIFISHFHPDHCSELSSFLHIALADPPKSKARSKEVSIFGPIGLKETINLILKAFKLEGLIPKFPINIIELSSEETISFQNIKISAFATNHSTNINCLSYRLESENKIFAYSGDTGDCEGVRNACQNADLAVIEASWPSEIQSKSHLSGNVTGKIAKECNIKHLVPTHSAPYYIENFDIQKDISQTYSGQITPAHDLLTIEI